MEGSVLCGGVVFGSSVGFLVTNRQTDTDLFVTLLVSLESETVSTAAMVGHTKPFFSCLVRLAVVGWGSGSGRMVRVMVRCGLKVKEGASGFWALVNGTSAIEQHFVVAFFFNQSPCFLWDFRILFSQIDHLDISNCTSFSSFNENEG